MLCRVFREVSGGWTQGEQRFVGVGFQGPGAEVISTKNASKAEDGRVREGGRLETV